MMEPLESRVLDINAEALGVGTDELMGNAGKALANEINARFGQGVKTIAIVCGTGNNGGDGFVAAGVLAELGWSVKVLMVKTREEVKGDVARSKLDAIGDGVKIIENACPVDWDDDEIILDSMLGTGISGTIRHPFKSWITSMNDINKTVISTDIPSGLGADIWVKPVMTVTFHDAKTGMTPENSGEIVVKDIGIPKEAEENVGLGEFVYYPLPDTMSHKGENGRLLIIGGGPYTGAPTLAALAALGVGADMVTIAVPENCFQVIAGFSPNFIVKPLAGSILATGHVDELLEMSEANDAVLIGPGLGRSPETLEAIRNFLAKVDKSKPVVVDADGLTALSGHLDVLALGGKSGVLTPHSGEFMMLAEGREDNSIKKMAEEAGFTILLKGKIDLISDGQNTKKNLTGNVAMTVGGTGDVLAGLVGGLMAKGVKPYNAARMGAFLSGAAGDVAFEEFGYSMMATDVVDNVPMILKTCLKM